MVLKISKVSLQISFKDSKPFLAFFVNFWSKTLFTWENTFCFVSMGYFCKNPSRKYRPESTIWEKMSCIKGCMVSFNLIISLVPYPDRTLSWATETNAYKKRDLLGYTLKENAPTKPLKVNILFHSHVWISSELQSKKSGENRKLIFTVFSGYLHGVRKKLFS